MPKKTTAGVLLPEMSDQTLVAVMRASAKHLRLGRMPSAAAIMEEAATRLELQLPN
jgi:hypothetical protein